MDKSSVMKVEKALRMATGDGRNSYAANTRLQEKVLNKTRPVLEKAIQDLYTSWTLAPDQGTTTMVVADLGCSSGRTALIPVTQVMSTVRACIRHRAETTDGHNSVAAVQFFLNDLPGNDFNLIFRSLENLQDDLASSEMEEGETTETAAGYVAGLPGSYYKRLFPSNTVHLFYSTFSLMWRSKVPEELSNGTHVNEENIYIGKTTSPTVVTLFQEQFRKDFKLFLALRYKELFSGGHMVLTFLGRKSEEMLLHGEVGSMWELLAESLQSLVQKLFVNSENSSMAGSHEKGEKLSSFNLPYYAPSVNEVKALVKEDNLFHIDHIDLFEYNWDPHDDSDGDVVPDCLSSGENVANRNIRTVIEPLIVEHFGEAIVDELFVVFASLVSKHLEIMKAKYPIIVVSLKKATRYV